MATKATVQTMIAPASASLGLIAALVLGWLAGPDASFGVTLGPKPRSC